jgi:hypothetical protein
MVASHSRDPQGGHADERILLPLHVPLLSCHATLFYGLKAAAVLLLNATVLASKLLPSP